MKNYVNLHNHDIFSLLDGHGRPERYAERAKELGMPALAVTNHGNVSGILDHYDACKAFDIKPILGIELYQARKTRFDRDEEERAGPARNEWDQRGPYHLTVLAKNEVGYKNLIKLSSRSFTEGYYVKPRADHELLADHAEGLILLSGCLNGEVQQALLRGDFDFALKTAATMQEIVGKENYFIEIQNHGIEEQLRILDDVIKIAKMIDAPLVPTGDCHYVHKDDHAHHDVMLCVGTRSLKEEENRFRFERNEFYLKSYDEMLEKFDPQWLKNSLDIAEMVELELKFDEFHFPIFPDTPANKTPIQYLEELTWQGVHEKYGESPSEEVQDRTRYELSVVAKMGFPDYFLVVSDLVGWARENGIRTGWGRGSAAGSIISYVLGITKIDPIKFGLIFERFLNPGRVSMPDIDLDFDDRYRDRVIAYARQKYGHERVAHIATFNSIGARSALRDAARVLGYEYAVGDKIANLVPDPILGVSKTLSECMEIADFRKLYDSDEETRNTVDAAFGLEGILRQPGIHAAGVVIAKSDITDYIPIMVGGEEKELLVTQMDMHRVEQLGLLKIDFLGLRNLGVISDTESILKQNGIEIDVDQIPLDDDATYQNLHSGNAVGVFQLESQGMRDIALSLQPESIEDIMALIALYRPGPLGSGMHNMYINRKHGREKLTYLHPSLETVLKKSWGIMLYQEDVLNVITILAGWSPGEADDLRRVIGKKKLTEVAKYREKFVNGCVDHSDLTPELANRIYSDIEYFAGYGFNMSHSISYGMVSYVTAYLKTHYPTEYMSALLSSVGQNPDRLSAYLREANRLGINILPPSINESEHNFSVVDAHTIRFGLSAVTGLGDAIIGNVLSSRTEKSYDNLYEFFRGVHIEALNKGVFEKMIYSGMLDELSTSVGRDITRKEKDFLLAMERNALGVYLTEHPLSDVEHLLTSQVSHSVERVYDLFDGETVTIGGIFTSVKRKTTKRGGFMYIAEFEDLTGSIDIIVFPKDAEKWEDQFEVGDIKLITGRLAVESVGVDESGSRRIFFSDMTDPDLPISTRGKPIFLSFTEQPSSHIIDKLHEFIMCHSGDSPVFFSFPSGDIKVTFRFVDGIDFETKDQIERIGAMFHDYA